MNADVPVVEVVAGVADRRSCNWRGRMMYFETCSAGDRRLVMAHWWKHEVRVEEKARFRSHRSHGEKDAKMMMGTDRHHGMMMDCCGEKRLQLA